MNGLSVEPGERSACVMSTWPARRAIEIIGGANTRAHFAARIIDREDGDRNLRPERARAFARQFLQGLLQAQHRW